ncbi:MAG: hypothetical protein ABJC39_04160 [Chloroflexota bacterium]
MGRLVVAADVRLELDDPSDAAPGGVVADQSRTDQGSSGLERGPLEQGPIDDAQPPAG